MGNRACVLFHDSRRVSPTVYLHWHGSQVPAWLADLRQQMQGRHSDAEYAAARFVGICHTHIDGNLGLGLKANSLTVADLARPSVLEDLSPGNAGLVVVNTADFSWRAYGGYLSKSRPQPERIQMT
ncbi:hypothetical protein R5W24_000523 [Gemmata sp. JC717]|uniref:hypothetical protein n=1 Tax=Gemmata algarum TaxID=2975278 RepID=UPI0021BAD4DF|nr:hypothetical protein [Gemmata algarum]MDY3551447.1 hypothetical protein [Gemmata algarum]